MLVNVGITHDRRRNASVGVYRSRVLQLGGAMLFCGVSMVVWCLLLMALDAFSLSTELLSPKSVYRRER